MDGCDLVNVSSKRAAMNPRSSVFLALVVVLAACSHIGEAVEYTASMKIDPYDLSELNGFQRIGDKYYFIEENAKENWYGAWLSCRSKNASLAWFENVGELNTVIAVLKSKGVNSVEGLWTSGSDLETKKKFVWMAKGGEVKGNMWQPGEPNDEGEERCVNVREIGGYGLNDYSCSKKIGYLCQLDLQISDVVFEKRIVFAQNCFQ